MKKEAAWQEKGAGEVGGVVDDDVDDDDVDEGEDDDGGDEEGEEDEEEEEVEGRGGREDGCSRKRNTLQERCVVGMLEESNFHGRIVG